MKGYYQPKGGKKGKFALRENTYRRIWYLIADYPYFKALERGNKDALEFSRQNVPADRVAEPEFFYDMDSVHVENAHCKKYIDAIEAAQKQIPEVYVGYIMSHIIEKKRYKDMDGASEKTLKIWQQRFIWYVAHNLGDV